MGCSFSRSEKVYVDVATEVYVDVATDMTNELVPCRIWIPSQSSGSAAPAFIHPENSIQEVSAKLDVGICLSGGGMRAACLAYGWLRGLQQQGVIEKARYLSSNSGGTWTHTPMAFSSQEDFDKFFTDFKQPQDCTLESMVSNTSSGHEAVLMKTDMQYSAMGKFLDYLKNGRDDDYSGDFWGKAVAESFFTASGLHSQNKAPSYYSQTPNHVFESYKTDLKKFPFSIINASIFVGSERKFIPLEFTPMYHGIPVECNIVEDLAFQIFLCDEGTIGGFYIEPHGLATSCPVASMPRISSDELRSVVDDRVNNNNQKGDGSSLLLIPKSARIVSLAECSGFSSSAVAAGTASIVGHASSKLANLPLLSLWDPKRGNSRELRINDGGSVDNCGILSLVRRGVTKIISCNATLLPVDVDSSDFTKLVEFIDLTVLFGRYTGEDYLGMSRDTVNASGHIFRSELWDEVLAGLRKSSAQGIGASHLLCTQVLPNSSIAVIGGFDISVLFLLNDRCRNWLNALPKDTKDALAEEKLSVLHVTSNLKSTNDLAIEAQDVGNKVFGDNSGSEEHPIFPFVSTSVLSYSPLTIRGLSQMATWQMLQNEGTIKSFLE